MSPWACVLVTARAQRRANRSAQRVLYSSGRVASYDTVENTSSTGVEELPKSTRGNVKSPRGGAHHNLDKHRSMRSAFGRLAPAVGRRIGREYPLRIANQAVRRWSSLQRERDEPLNSGAAAKLFTPGPLTTSRGVKEAMQKDLGSRSPEMVDAIAEIRSELLRMAHVTQDAGYECVLMQGSGTFAIESVLSSVVPATGRLLVLSNGAYGRRIAQMAERYAIEHSVLAVSERDVISPDAVEAELLRATAAADERSYSHVAVIHHETTSGILNPMHEIGEAIQRVAPGTSYIVDSMSAFGAYEVDMGASHITYMVSSANKNIEGVPGFAFAICRRDRLLAEAGSARTISLDLLAQWHGLEGNGQFRFTPPTHALLAFRQALHEHRIEGGSAARLARYEANAAALKSGMLALGLSMYVEREKAGCIISTFLYPDDPKFDFDALYAALVDRGLVIYPGKLTEVDCFRVGSIGRLFPDDMDEVVTAIRDILIAQGVKLPAA